MNKKEKNRKKESKGKQKREEISPKREGKKEN